MSVGGGGGQKPHTNTKRKQIIYNTLRKGHLDNILWAPVEHISTSGVITTPKQSQIKTT